MTGWRTTGSGRWGWKSAPSRVEAAGQHVVGLRMKQSGMRMKQSGCA